MRFFQRIFDVGAPFVAIYAVCLILLPWAQLHAQRQDYYQSYSDNDVSRRVENIEKLNIDRRVTVLETIEQDAKDNSIWYKGSSVGTGILLLEAVFRIIARKKEEE